MQLTFSYRWIFVFIVTLEVKLFLLLVRPDETVSFDRNRRVGHQTISRLDIEYLTKIDNTRVDAETLYDGQI